MEQYQNWEYTVLTKNKSKSFSYYCLAKQTGEKASNKAGQLGQHVETVAKQSATNKKGQMTGQYIHKKLEEESYENQTVSHDFKMALQQARVKKGMDQKTLANRINEKQSVIQEYENGKAIPNPQVISKLERALGTRLPRDKKKKKKEEDE